MLFLFSSFLVCFCVFVSFVFFFCCVCFFLFLLKIIVFPAIPVFFGLLKSESLYLMSVSGSCFCFCCILFLFHDIFFLLVVLLCFDAEKTDILTRTVSTGVFTDSVFFFSFLCFFQFCIFAENTIKIGVSPPPPLLYRCPSLGRCPRSEGLRYWCRCSSALCFAICYSLMLRREEPFYLASARQSTLEPW